MAVDQSFIKNLAEANGLNIPEERLEAVLRQYQSFLRTLERIDTIPLTRETEPAIRYTLEPGAGVTPESSREKEVA